jgi:hypothetical protein
VQIDNNAFFALLPYHDRQLDMTSYQHQTFLPCATSKCNNESGALCYCCQQNYCLRHLIEHNDSFNPQLNFLFTEMNNLGEQINKLNIPQINRNCRQQLQQWRVDCHLIIDRYFDQKCDELNRFVDYKVGRKRMEFSRLQSKMTELIREQEINDDELDLLRSTIDDLRTETNNLEQLYNHINIQPLVINNNLIDFETSNEPKVNLSILSPMYRTINHPHGSYGTLANNDRFMLIHLAPNLILIDKQINIIKQVSWPYDTIWNMCWSSTLNRFIIIEKNNIYLIDDQTMTIENLRIPQRRKWFSCTCSDTSLFLSLDDINPSIMEFNLLPSITLVKQWTTPYICRKDERVDDIVYGNSSLALMIANKLERSLRMELRSCETFERIWSIRLNMNFNQNKPFRCCSISSNEWLMADYENQRLLHITKDGELKATITYNGIPCRVVLFGSDYLAISRKNGINFHKL